MVPLSDLTRDALLLLGMALSSYSTVEIARQRKDRSLFWVSLISMLIFAGLAVYIALGIFNIF